MRSHTLDIEELRQRLAQRAADAAFTSAEAAIYTGRSIRTLKRAIDAGVGPKREKNPDVSGLAATNRHTRYRKSDLDAWRESLVSFATDFRSFNDLVADAPWVMDGDRVVGHLLDLDSIEALLEALRDEAVQFLRLEEALALRWQNVELRKRYQAVLSDICFQAIATTKAAIERDAIEDTIGQTPSGDERQRP